MATTIVTKSGSGAPTASDLVAGELAVDLTNGRLYTEDSGGTVLELGLNPNGNVNVTGNIESDSVTIGVGAVAGTEKLRVNGTILTLGGTVAIPAIGVGDTNTGVYAPTSGTLGWTVNGVQRLLLDSTGIDVTGSVTALSAQDYQFTAAYDGTNSTSYGYYGIKNNNVGNPFYFHVGGEERMRIDASGNVGIGTSSVIGNLNLHGGTGDTAAEDVVQTFTRISSTGNVLAAKIRLDSSTTTHADLKFQVKTTASSAESGSYYTDALTIKGNTGNVGIGASLPQAPLHVAGNILCDAFNNGGAGNGLFFRKDFLVTSQPSITLKDHNGSSADGLSINAFDGISFSLDDSEKMRIDASGRVGIGRTPSLTNSKLEVGGADNVSLINVEASGVTGGLGIGSTGLQFFHGSSAKMRIDASGNLLVGKTSVSFATAGIELKADNVISISRSAGTCLNANRIGSSAGSVIIMHYDSVDVGSIDVTASATSYTTSSDQRLKENIADADDAGSKIDAIQVRKFDWKVDGSHQDYGMVAQELLEVAPEAVSQGETEEEMMGVDYSKLVPMMLKEIQSLRARIAALES